MALNESVVFEARRAAQYTGANSADFNAAISDFSIVSENAGGLTFMSGGTQYTVAPNGYVVWLGTAVTEVFQNANDYQEVYSELTDELGLNHIHYIATGPGVVPNGNA
jgi:hypothetical protein